MCKGKYRRVSVRVRKRLRVIVRECIRVRARGWKDVTGARTTALAIPAEMTSNEDGTMPEVSATAHEYVVLPCAQMQPRLGADVAGAGSVLDETRRRRARCKLHRPPSR